MFIYPVSGVLKLWHLLLHNVLGMDDSQAWLISLFGLVVTVRALIVPFHWIQIRSARTGVLLRPEKAALDAKYAEATDKESIAEHQAAEKELHRRYGYKPAAGCVPALIQIPTFLGLYQVLLRMARPSEDLAVAEDYRIGFLNAEEISAFIDARVGGVPLPAYIAMPEDTLALLGTTSGEVRDFVLPFLIAAIIFTVVNLAFSIHRNLKTLDWDSSVARGLTKFLVAMALFIPLLLLGLGLLDPIPVAIILYWFANNLWTLGQAIISELILSRRMPLDEEYIIYSRERRTIALENIRAQRRRKRHIRLQKLRGLVQPWKLTQIRRDLIAEEQEHRRIREEEKAERKKLNKAKSAARAQLTRERMQQRKAERKAKKAAKAGVPAGPDDTDEQPEQPTETADAEVASGATDEAADGGVDKPEPGGSGDPRP